MHRFLLWLLRLPRIHLQLQRLLGLELGLLRRLLGLDELGLLWRLLGWRELRSGLPAGRDVRS